MGGSIRSMVRIDPETQMSRIADNSGQDKADESFTSRTDAVRLLVRFGPVALVRQMNMSLNSIHHFMGPDGPEGDGNGKFRIYRRLELAPVERCYPDIWPGGSRQTARNGARGISPLSWSFSAGMGFASFMTGLAALPFSAGLTAFSFSASKAGGSSSSRRPGRWQSPNPR